MDYGAQGGATSGDIAKVLQSVSNTQAAAGVNTAPVVTESLDLDAIYQATYEAEMAKYNAQLQPEVSTAAVDVAAIQTMVNYDTQGLAALNNDTMSQVAAQTVPQDLTNINQLLANYNSTPPVNLSGGLTAGGFVMPEGIERETVYKIIAAEGGEKSPQEAVNIASTMINRARAGNYGGGDDIYKIATAPSQYVAYENNSYKSKALTPEARAAVDQLFASASLGGATAHQYKSFRANNYDTGVELTPGGNKYR